MNWHHYLETTPTFRLCLALFHSLWQFGLLAAFVWLVDRCWKRQPLKLKYASHVAALAIGLAAVPITMIVEPQPAVIVPAKIAEPTVGLQQSSLEFAPTAEASATISDNSTTPASSAMTSAPLHDAWSNVLGFLPAAARWLVGAYVAGVAVMLIRFCNSSRQAKRLQRSARPIRSGPQFDALQTLANSWSIKILPLLLEAESVVVPKVVGLLRPVILLPLIATSGLSNSELEMILAHELAHIRRYDMWFHLLERIAEVVLFFNPAVWFLTRRINILRELCCDELACSTLTSRFSHQRLQYAETLLRVAELHFQRIGRSVGKKGAELADLTSLAATGRSPSELRYRVSHLLGEPLRDSLLLTRGGVTMVVTMLLALTAGPLLALSGDQPAAPAATDNGAATSTDDLFVSGSIQDEAGRGIAGAEVGMMIIENVNNSMIENHPFAATGKSDAEGRYRLPLSGPLRKKWGTVWAHAPGYGPVRWSSTGSLAAFAGENTIDLKLDAAKQTVIQILDEEKRPVQNVDVRVLQVQVKGGVGYSIPVDWAERFRATSDAQGLAVIRSFVPASLDRVSIDSASFGCVEFQPHYFLNVSPQKQSPQFVFPTPAVGRVEGQLKVSGAGAPKFRAVTIRTEVVPAFGFADGVIGVAPLEIDASGRFTAKKIAAGKLSVEVETPMSSRWRARVPTDVTVVAGQTTNLKIPVEPAVRIAGLIRKQDTGEGYPKFSLGVIYGKSAKTHDDMNDVVEVETDRDGKFSAYVPPGPIELRLHSAPRDYHHVEWWDDRARGGIWGTRREIPDGVKDFELEPIDLAPTIQVEGQLVDQQGKPLVGWTVFGYPDNKAAGPEHVAKGLGPMNSFAGVDTDKEGRFRGIVASTYPPVNWKISHTLRDNRYKQSTKRYLATIASTKPLVLQVEVEKPTDEN